MYCKFPKLPWKSKEGPRTFKCFPISQESCSTIQGSSLSFQKLPEKLLEFLMEAFQTTRKVSLLSRMFPELQDKFPKLPMKFVDLPEKLPDLPGKVPDLPGKLHKLPEKLSNRSRKLPKLARTFFKLLWKCFERPGEVA